MKSTTLPLNWLTLNCLWYLLVGFFLAYTPVWAQAIILPLALVLTLAKTIILVPVITWTLSSGLAGGLSGAFATSVFDGQAGQLAMAFAMVVFLGWTVPGLASLAIAGVISLAAALMWAKTMNLSVLLSAAGIGAIGGIFAVTLPEIVTGARNDLLPIVGKTYTLLVMSGVSLVGWALGQWVKHLLS